MPWGDLGKALFNVHQNILLLKYHIFDLVASWQYIKANKKVQTNKKNELKKGFLFLKTLFFIFWTFPVFHIFVRKMKKNRDCRDIFFVGLLARGMVQLQRIWQEFPFKGCTHHSSEHHLKSTHSFPQNISRGSNLIFPGATTWIQTLSKNSWP